MSPPKGHILPSAAALALIVLAAACSGGPALPTPGPATPEPAPTVEQAEADTEPDEIVVTEEEAAAAGGDSPDEEEGPAVDVLFDYLRAVGLLQAGMYKEAVGSFNVVLRIHPDLYLAYRGRGLARYNEDQFDLALEDFNRAIEIKPDYAEALRDRGVMHANQRRHAEARRDLERAVEIYRAKGDVVAMSEALTQLQRLP